MAGMSLHRPVFTIILERVPDEWPEKVIPSEDLHVPNGGWTCLQRKPRRLGYQGVGQNAALVLTRPCSHGGGSGQRATTATLGCGRGSGKSGG